MNQEIRLSRTGNILNKYFVASLFALQLIISSCTKSETDDCDSMLNYISMDLGENPRYLVDLPEINPTNTDSCNSKFIQELRNRWSYVDSLTILPSKISAIQVLSVGPYRATSRIKNMHGQEVAYSVQYFGLEKFDSCKADMRKRLSFLIWNMKDKYGNTVPDGVYEWKMEFEGYRGSFSDSIRIGVILLACKNESHNLGSKPKTERIPGFF